MPKLGTYILEIGGDEVELDFDSLVPIGTDLSHEFSTQAANYAYIATLAAQCEALWGDAKEAKDEMYAKTDKAVRSDLDRSGMKVTEGLVSSEVRQRRGYREAVDNELFCREQHLVMRAMTRAMDMRAQMLISLGAHLRAEAEQTDMHIKEVKGALKKARRGKKPSPSAVKEGEFDPSEYGF
jgi:hypothetical protein